MITFKNKKILVTGASSGIGREISIHLSELGAKVVLVARDEDRLKETISLMKQPEIHKYFCYDLENIDNISNLISSCIEYDNIKFDGFVHCAGVPAIIPLKVLDYKKFEKVFKINTYSYLEIVKHISKKQNSNDEASIVFISSLTTKILAKGEIAYMISKVSAENISKVLSVELIKRKIRVNNVVSGAIETTMLKSTESTRLLNTESYSEENDTLYRILSPREVSNLILFLLSDSAKYIIGENYLIGGGDF